MKSPNFTVFILVGFYLLLVLLQQDGTTLVGSKSTYLAIVTAFLPVALFCRGRPVTALWLILVVFLSIVTIFVIQTPELSPDAFESLLLDPPLPVKLLVALLVPGLFMVSELDIERLPHELSYWSGLRIFRPIIPVLAGRERVLRRLSTIRETCQLRGIELNTRFQHLCKIHIWLVPLVVATICEAAYAAKYRRMIGSGDRFVPTQPKTPVLSMAQKVLRLLFIVSFILVIQRLARTWTAT